MDADLSTLRNVEETMLALAKLLVDDSEAVRLEVIVMPTETLIRLHVASVDMGKLIGMQGRTARSLRTILHSIGMKYKRSFALDIVGSQKREPERCVAVAARMGAVLEKAVVRQYYCDVPNFTHRQHSDGHGTRSAWIAISP